MQSAEWQPSCLSMSVFISAQHSPVPFPSSAHLHLQRWRWEITLISLIGTLADNEMIYFCILCAKLAAIQGNN